MVTPEQFIDAAFAIGEGRQADVELGDAPEEVVIASMRALVAIAKELEIELTGRFGDEARTVAHAACIDAIDLDCTKLRLKISRPTPRVIRRRTIERDDQGRAVALVDSELHGW